MHVVKPQKLDKFYFGMYTSTLHADIYFIYLVNLVTLNDILY